MKSQMGYLQVISKRNSRLKFLLSSKASLLFSVSPDIIDNPTANNDVIVHEYENVTLSCSASGSPGLNYSKMSNFAL